MLNTCSMCVRRCAHGLPSSVLLPWLQSYPISSAAGSSRHCMQLWLLEGECLKNTPGTVRIGSYVSR